MDNSDKPHKSKLRQDTFNYTLAAVIGQVGCLTVLIIFLTLFLGLAANSNAQLTALGLKAGVNYSSTVIDRTFTADGIKWNYATREADVAPVYGAFFRIKILSVFIQPEIMFSDHKTNMKLNSINLDTFLTLRQNRIDVPLLIGFSKGDRVRAYIGPVYTRMLQNKVLSNEFLHDEIREILSTGLVEVR